MGCALGARGEAGEGVLLRAEELDETRGLHVLSVRACEIVDLSLSVNQVSPRYSRKVMTLVEKDAKARRVADPSQPRTAGAQPLGPRETLQRYRDCTDGLEESTHCVW